MKLSSAVNIFYHSMATIKANTTVEWYRKQLDPLVQFLDDPEIDHITIEDLERYRASLNRLSCAPGHTHTPVSAYTIHGTVRAIKRFFSQCRKRKIITIDPSEDLQKPQIPKQPRKGIPEKDAIKIIQDARITNYRDYALILFIAETGCRIGGAANLLTQDIDLPNQRATVHEKGSKSRSVFFTGITANAITQYLYFRENPSNHPTLFLTWDSKPLTKHAIYQIFKRHAERAGVKDHWNPHEWRHAAIRAWLQAGMNLKTASELAGHCSEAITGDIYGTLRDSELQTEYIKYEHRFS